MTSLGLIDIVDARASRAAGGAAGRSATPGAAAFADVIQDAARAQRTDDAPAESTPRESALPTGTTPDAAADTSVDTAIPVPTVVVSLPGTVIPPAGAESPAPATGVAAQVPDSGQTDVAPPAAALGASPSSFRPRKANRAAPWSPRRSRRHRPQDGPLPSRPHLPCRWRPSRRPQKPMTPPPPLRYRDREPRMPSRHRPDGSSRRPRHRSAR
ncbi:hypothetical protein [Microbacterium sp. Se63.02b]|uniref:hypothetical protein n=1 Tax=Microbacterium sp. Se63.02b TaxID=2709304 RepID=UPI0016050D08|nr:hypothetical protein [Microbacterium sp. Se63.02b]QNA92023.1 hypothetical protein G4G29_05485 [Microbacterium sp. Se63.02b]